MASMSVSSHPTQPIAQGNEFFRTQPKLNDSKSAEVVRKFFETDLPNLARIVLTQIDHDYSIPPSEDPSEVFSKLSLNLFILAGKNDYLNRLSAVSSPNNMSPFVVTNHQMLGFFQDASRAPIQLERPSYGIETSLLIDNVNELLLQKNMIPEKVKQAARILFQADMPFIARYVLQKIDLNNLSERDITPLAAGPSSKFTEIERIYGLNVFILGGKFDQLKGLFAQEFPDRESLRRLSLEDLTRYHDLRLIPTSLFKELTQPPSFSQNCQECMEQILIGINPYNPFQVLRSFSIFETMQPQRGGFGFKIESEAASSRFEYRAIVDQFKKEFSDLETFFKTFENPYRFLSMLRSVNSTRPQYDRVQIEPFLSEGQWGQIEAEAKEFLLNKGKDLSFSELCQTIETEDQWTLFYPPKELQLWPVSKADVLIHVFGEEAVKAKFEQEFRGLPKDVVLSRLGDQSELSPFPEWLSSL